MKLARENTFGLALSVAILLASTAVRTVAGGKEFTISLKDSTSISGELLAIRPGSLVINLHPWVSEKQLQAHPDWATVVPLQGVATIHVAGHRNAMPGGVAGIAGGMAIGALLGYNASTSGNFLSRNRTVNAEAGAFMGILPGFLAGIFVGVLIETDARDISPTDEIEVPLLAKDARYPDNEPEFLKVIGAE